MSADEFETLDESTDDEESETESEEADAETLEESTDDEETNEQADESEAVPVEEVSGIGPTYSERLADVGTETVADLASADPTAVAEAAEVSESRAEDWITAAEEY
jgi:polyhydroxyalkanoate synthase